MSRQQFNQQHHSSVSPAKQMTEAIVGQKTTEQSLKNEIQHLKQELSFQNNLNVRLNKELAGYQKRLGLEQIPLTEKLDGNQQMDLIYLSPLFTAYDDRIQKMDQMIDTLIDDLKELENKTQHLVEDNSYLRKQIEEKDEQIIQAYKSGGGQDYTIQNVFSKLEKDELNEKIRLFQDECQFYITKIKEFENKTWDQQNRIQAMDRNERDYLNQIHELQDENKKLELELDDFKVKRDILDQKLRNQLNMNAQTSWIQDEEKSDFVQRISKQENENKVLRHQINSLKVQLQEQIDSYDKNNDELNKEIDVLRQKEKDQFNKVIFMERELDQVKDDNRRLKKELDQAKGDLEQTIRIMENYENKIQVYQKKEEQALQVQKELKEKCEQALLERDKLSLKEQQFDQTLQNYLIKSRDDIQILKETNDKALNQIKHRHRVLVEQKDDEIVRLTDETTQAQILAEKLQKENRSLKIQVNKFESGLRNDIESSNSQIDELMRQVNELQEKCQLQEQTAQDNETAWHYEKQQLEGQVRNQSQNNADLRQALEQTRSQLTTATQELTTIKSKVTQLTRQNQQLIEELQKTKKHYESRIETLQDEYIYKNDSTKREKASRERAVQLLQQYDSIEEKLKAEYQARIQDLEYQLSQLRSQNKVLTIKLQELKEQQYGTLKR